MSGQVSLVLSLRRRRREVKVKATLPTAHQRRRSERPPHSLTADWTESWSVTADGGGHLCREKKSSRLGLKVVGRYGGVWRT
uniref:Uncharacterized protein n=1 Tax=Knipowitschia caucasica TaxID=637954 RepID=A0AAV2M2W5_KNICA